MKCEFVNSLCCSYVCINVDVCSCDIDFVNDEMSVSGVLF